MHLFPIKTTLSYISQESLPTKKHEHSRLETHPTENSFILNPLQIIMQINSQFQTLTFTKYQFIIENLLPLSHEENKIVQQYCLLNFADFPIFFHLQLALELRLPLLLKKCRNQLLREEYEQLNYERFHILNCSPEIFEWVLNEHERLVSQKRLRGLQETEIKKIIHLYCFENEFLQLDEKNLFLQIKLQLDKRCTKKLVQDIENSYLEVASLEDQDYEIQKECEKQKMEGFEEKADNQRNIGEALVEEIIYVKNKVIEGNKKGKTKEKIIRIDKSLAQICEKIEEQKLKLKQLCRNMNSLLPQP